MKALLACLLAVCATQDTESDAWSRALGLKQKEDFAAAAQAFEHFRSSFPASAHAAEAQVEAGVCWFSDGRAKQVLHRTTPAAKQSFELALAEFERATSERAGDALSSRAAYMKGSTHLFMGELQSAEADFGAVLATFDRDPVYVGKALERRASTRRQLLRTSDAQADLRRWLADVGSPPETRADVELQLTRTLDLDRAAPPLDAEALINAELLNGELRNGEPLTLEALAGRVVGLYFFATWCPNCAKESPFVLDLAQRFGARGLQLIGVVDHSKGQSADSVRAFAAKEHLPYPIFMDKGTTATRYHETTIPFLVLIDGEGRLRWSDHPAALTDWTLATLLDAPAHEALDRPDAAHK